MACRPGIKSAELEAVAVRRPGNALALADWLRQGQLDPLDYRVHLLAWLAAAASVAAHLWGELRRGGTPLLRAMFSLKDKTGTIPGRKLDIPALPRAPQRSYRDRLSGRFSR